MSKIDFGPLYSDPRRILSAGSNPWYTSHNLWLVRLIDLILKFHNFRISVYRQAITERITWSRQVANNKFYIQAESMFVKLWPVEEYTNKKYYAYLEMVEDFFFGNSVFYSLILLFLNSILHDDNILQWILLWAYNLPVTHRKLH